MKKLLLIFILYVGFGLANETVEVKSNIREVTVYQRGAQIKRKAYYKVNKGVSVITIPNVSSQVDPNSIQINASGKIVMLDSKFKLKYPEPTTNQNNEIPLKIKREIKAIEDSLFYASYQMMEINNQIDVLQSEKRIIENNGAIKGQGKVNDSLPLLEHAIEYYHKKMNGINAQLLELNKTKSLLGREQNRMNQRLSDLKNYAYQNQNTTQSNQPIPQIEITVSTNEYTSGSITVSYLVNSAGWIPLYDLRSNAAKNEIDLTYKAQVYQNTGVEWENIKLNLSTTNPYTNKTKPDLNPWYVNYIQQYQTRSNYGGAYKKEYHSKPASINTAADVSDYETEEISESYSLNDVEVSAMNSTQFTQVIEQLLSVEYAIDLPYSISSNNEKQMVLINTKNLNTEYKYYAVPKLDVSTFLVSQITNIGDLNLIPGNAAIFHDGAYLGTTYLNPSVMSDTMNLSLGKDQNIQIKRTLLKSESKQKVIGDKILKTFAYKIEIKNHKNSTIKLTVQDQIPITQNAEIDIELINGSKGRLNEITGLIEWDLKLKPGQSESIDLVFTVNYNKQKTVNLPNN